MIEYIMKKVTVDKTENKVNKRENKRENNNSI